MRRAIAKNEIPERLRKKPKLSLYDAVAGRASYEGFLSTPTPSRYRDWTSNTLTPVPPEEVLSRFHDAPTRYEEDDIYFAHGHLDRSNELQRLPDSDVVKTLHAYASDFYATTPQVRGYKDFKSLDETALLAFGILVEEAARQICSEEQSPAESEDNPDIHIRSETSDSTIKSESSKSTMKSEVKSESEGTAQTSQTLSQGVKVERDASAGAGQSAVSRGVEVEPDEAAVASQSSLGEDDKMEIDSEDEVKFPMPTGRDKRETSGNSQSSSSTLSGEPALKMEPNEPIQTSGQERRRRRRRIKVEDNDGD